MSQFCMQHWTMLREAIKDRGLGGLISTSGGEVVEKLTAEKLTDAERFDPLAGAWLRITEKLLDVFGFQVLTEGCPICRANASHDAECDVPDCGYSYDNWIGYAADEALLTWQEINKPKEKR